MATRREVIERLQKIANFPGEDLQELKKQVQTLAGVLDAQFLTKQRIPFLVLIAFGPQSDSRFRAVGRPTSSIDCGILGE
jgi:hypothetical protein